jgi:hypothetical protein
MHVFCVNVKKVLNFVVDVLEFGGFVRTSIFMYFLGGGNLIAYCPRARVTYRKHLNDNWAIMSFIWNSL